MIKHITLISLLLLPSVTFAEGSKSVSLSDVVRSAEESAPVVLLERLESKAFRAQGLSQVGSILPELGLEGGARSNREAEKRNDHFYYAYARYDLSLKVIAELKSGLAKKELGNVDQKLAKARAIQALVVEYFRVLSLQKEIELKEGDLSISDKQLTAARKRVEGGLATESDLLEFQMHQNEFRNELRTLKVELELGYQEIQRLSGLKEKPTSLVYEIIDPSISANEAEVLEAAIRMNPELAKIKADAGIATAEKLSAYGEFLPRLSAEAQYGKLQETDFVESRKNSWAVVGKITLPLFNGGSSASRVSEKTAEAERAHLLFQLQTTRLKDQVRALINRQTQLSEKLKGEQENLKATQKYFDLVMSEYRRGVKNSPDVASATDKLFSAKWRVFETWRDLTLAVVELQLIQGKEWKL